MHRFTFVQGNFTNVPFKKIFLKEFAHWILNTWSAINFTARVNTVLFISCSTFLEVLQKLINICIIHLTQKSIINSLMYFCHYPWKYQQLCGVAQLIRWAEGEEGQALDFLSCSETQKGQCTKHQYLSSSTESSEQAERELGQGKCPAGKGRCTSTREARTWRGDVHTRVEESVTGTKCQWGCCYAEEVAPRVCAFCRGQTLRNCSSPAAVQESWLNTTPFWAGFAGWMVRV